MKPRTKDQRKQPRAKTQAMRYVPVTPAEPRWQLAVGVALLLALVAVAYVPVVRAGFIWDDESYVEGNEALRTFDGLRRIWVVPETERQYYPLVHTTFWIEYHLWGLHPLGYHLVNVMLHGASAVLFWRLLVRLSVPGAWLAAAIFAVHPVMVESAAWVTERKNVLSLLLALLALHAYFRFAPPARTENHWREQTAGEWRWYAISLALFVAALLSKTVVASMPAVILVIFWWKRGEIVWDDGLAILAAIIFSAIDSIIAFPPERGMDLTTAARAYGEAAGATIVQVVVYMGLYYLYRRRFTWGDCFELLPFFVIGIVLGFFTVLMEKHNVGARGVEFDFSPVERLLIAGRAVWFYAGKLAWPSTLVFFYPRFKIDDHALWQYLFPIAAVALIIALWWWREKIGRGPLAAVLIFAGVLVPALGFFNVYPFRYSFVADHFQYHASLALFAMAGAGAAWLWKQLPEQLYKAAPVAAGLLLVVLAGLTFSQALTYRDLETLYHDTIAKNPEGWTAYSNLGVYVESLGRHDEAFGYFQKAVELNPNDANMPSNMGHILLKLAERDGFTPERIDEMMRYFHRALELNPNLIAARRGLGFALVHANRPNEAIEQFSRTLTLRPNDADSWSGHGVVLAAAGRAAESEQSFRRALEINPNYVDALRGLAMLCAQQRRTAEAVQFLERTVALKPNYPEAQYELGNQYALRKEFARAQEHYAKAVALRPNFAEGWLRLGAAHGDLSQFDQAIECFQKALQLDPTNGPAQANLQKARELKEKQAATR